MRSDPSPGPDAVSNPCPSPCSGYATSEIETFPGGEGGLTHTATPSSVTRAGATTGASNAFEPRLAEEEELERGVKRQAYRRCVVIPSAVMVMAVPGVKTLRGGGEVRWEIRGGGGGGGY